jgi:hypothetical protein
MKIKYLPVILLFSFLCLILGDCEEEKAVPREYPRLNTLPVRNITKEGATFSADLYSLGNETINEFGFVWGPGLDPQINGDKIAFQGNRAAGGIYSAEIRSTLVEELNIQSDPLLQPETI